MASSPERQPLLIVVAVTDMGMPPSTAAARGDLALAGLGPGP